MFKDKKIPKTIHLPGMMWDVLDEEARVCVRNRSLQIEYIVTEHFKRRAKSDEEAMLMVVQSKKKPGEAQ